jgi:hypothetical protein
VCHTDGHFMGYRLPIEYRSKVSNTVSTVDTSISYGSSIVCMKTITEILPMTEMNLNQFVR